MLRYQFTRVSSNAKTGAIPTTMTQRDSCPSTCPLRGGKGCYAENFPLSLHWNKVKESGINLLGLAKKLRALPKGALWRHNVAGDLAHNNGAICADTLRVIVAAQQGKRGYTYTHHDLSDDFNRDLVAWSNDAGFTINASCHTVRDAESLLKKSKIPSLAVINSDEKRKAWKTENGAQVIVCPSQVRDTTCAECKLCANASRNCIIAFLAHGGKKKIVNQGAWKAEVTA